MVVAVSLDKEFIPIFNQDFTVPQKSFWVFLIPLRLIYGALAQLYLSYTQDFHYFQEKMKLNS